MISKGTEFYDDPAVFAEYWRRRARKENANTLLEGPVFGEIVGDVQGLRVLDLGCGDAAYGVELLAEGAASYVGVDGSANMVQKAREMLAELEDDFANASVEKGSGSDGLDAALDAASAAEGASNEAARRRLEVQHGDIAEIEFAPGSFDLVVSRLVLHYLEDLGAMLAKIQHWLAPGGRMVFSVEHPTLLCCSASLEASARRGSWIVDDYFLSGARKQPWLGGEVVKYHRTVEEYFALVLGAGFQVEALRESKPVRERFDSEEEFARRARIPLFLFLGGRKGSEQT